jgi:hypothetical protein
MISIEEIKQLVIQRETGWIEEINDDQDIPMYVNGMKDDVNECKNMNDIVEFFMSTGLDVEESYMAIIQMLRENTKVKE